MHSARSRTSSSSSTARSMRWTGRAKARRTWMISGARNSAEELRRAGLEAMRSGDYDRSIELFDQALTAAKDDDARELITINKAGVLISMEKNGPEVQALASIIMRRRNLRHVDLAAYWLQFKHRIEGDLKRAIFYGQLALRAAEE